MDIADNIKWCWLRCLVASLVNQTAFSFFYIRPNIKEKSGSGSRDCLVAVVWCHGLSYVLCKLRGLLDWDKTNAQQRYKYSSTFSGKIISQYHSSVTA